MPIRLVACLFILVSGMAAAQRPPILGGGKTLEELVNSETYVTLVLTLGGKVTRDSNIQIVGVGDTYLSVVLLDGTRTSYLLKDIREIRIQEGKVSVVRTTPAPGGALGGDDLDVVGHSLGRAYDIFTQATGDQLLRMRAASVIAATEGERQADAKAYLEGLSRVNDTATSVEASILLYLIGGTPNADVVKVGLESGVRKTRAAAAKLAGLTGDTSLQHDVRALLRDPTVEVYPEAVKAVGRLGDTMSIEALVRGLQALNETKNEAAVFALTRLGGPAVVDALKPMLETSRGNEWFRVLRVLYALQDPTAITLMRERAFRDASFTIEAAMILCRDKDWDATLYLRDELEKARNPTRDNLLLKARMAAALFEGDHLPAKTILQELLSMEPDDVYDPLHDDDSFRAESIVLLRTSICRLVAEIHSRSLMSLLPPVVQSQDPNVTLSACEAALAIANPDYANRLEEVRR